MTNGIIQPNSIARIRKRRATIALFHNNEDVLLAKRQKGGMGEGLLTGYGGKQEEGESLYDCMVREVWVETGRRVHVLHAELIGTLISRLHVRDGLYPVSIMSIAIFRVDWWRGTPGNSKEMANPQWHPYTQLPLGRMFKADEIWIPEVMRGFTVNVNVSYRIHDLSVQSLTMEHGGALSEDPFIDEEMPKSA